MTLDQTIRQVEQNGEADENPRYDILKAMQVDGVTDIPFVVIAMTREEAGEFFDGKEEVFSYQQNTSINSDQIKRFQTTKRAFHQLLPADVTRDDWCRQYSEDRIRENWIPLSGNMAITELVEQAVIDYYQNMNPPAGGHYTHGKRPRFFWPDFRETASELFDRDVEKRLKAWGELHRYYNSVLVIDSLSLFHPFIRDVLKASPLAWRNAHIGVLILFPDDESPLSALRPHIKREIQAEMSVAFTCSKHYYEPLYQFDIDEVDEVNRWLHTSRGMDNLILSQQSWPDPDNIQQARAASPAPDATIMTGGAS
jgi:hypothetical protein